MGPSSREEGRKKRGQVQPSGFSSPFSYLIPPYQLLIAGNMREECILNRENGTIGAWNDRKSNKMRRSEPADFLSLFLPYIAIVKDARRCNRHNATMKILEYVNGAAKASLRRAKCSLKAGPTCGSLFVYSCLQLALGQFIATLLGKAKRLYGNEGRRRRVELDVEQRREQERMRTRRQALFFFSSLSSSTASSSIPYAASFSCLSRTWHS